MFELSKVEHEHVCEAIVGHLQHIEEELAGRVATGLGMKRMPAAPTAAAPVRRMKPSPALQIIGKMKDTLIGRTIGFPIADGSMSAVDGELAGTPSVLFDGVAVILSKDGATTLSKESAAIQFVRDAFGHLKAIAVDEGGRTLLEHANVGRDAGVVNASDKAAFIGAARIRQWDRESFVRMLA